MSFPILPVIEKFKQSEHEDFNLSNVLLVCVQHLVETTGSLFESLIQLGFKPDNIYLKGKIYSTNEKVEAELFALGLNIIIPSNTDKYGHIREIHRKDITRMWDMVLNRLTNNEKIIILDDGGLVIRTLPIHLLQKHRIFAIEQTTAGLRFQQRRPDLSIVQVATCAAKTILEPPLISRALHRKLQSIFKLKRPKAIGVVGFGHIGKATASFLSKTFKVFIFDIIKSKLISENRNISISDSLESLILHCDIVIGATGIDITSEINWDAVINENKTLISVSSNDTEFNSLIRKLNVQTDFKRINPLKDLKISFGENKVITVIRGGTVANFDNSQESCRKNEIQLTRALLLAGVFQILTYIDTSDNETGPHELRADYQKQIVNSWFKYNPHYRKIYDPSIIRNFQDEAWIADHSKAVINSN